MIRYAYQLKDFRSWLKGFSKILKLPVVAGTIEIPSAMGNGTRDEVDETVEPVI